MRRVIVTLVAILALQGAWPQPAHAWWDYIEQLSGPGPLRGFDIEARVRCYAKADGQPGLVQVAVVGVIVNFCDIPANHRRVLSIDVGARYVRRNNDGRFASGRSISMMTFEPAVTWNFVPSTKYDFVEAGFGAGLYWFHSGGFEDFTGVVLDPRLDFRVPTAFESDHWFLRPVLRFGVLAFPGGFTESQFAAAPGVMIHERAAKYFAFFWDLRGNRPRS